MTTPTTPLRVIARVRPDSDEEIEGVMITASAGRMIILGDGGQFYDLPIGRVRAAPPAAPDAWQWARPLGGPGLYEINDGVPDGRWRCAMGELERADVRLPTGYVASGPWEPCGNKETFHIKRPLRRVTTGETP